MKKKQVDIVEIVVYAIIGLTIVYLAAQVGYALDQIPTKGSMKTLMVIQEGLERNISNPRLLLSNIFNKSTQTFKMTFYSLMGCILWLLYKQTQQKKFRKGEEHGSARWATPREAKKLSDKKMENNIILNQEVQLSLNTRKTRKNLNITVIGGAGAGKTRFFAKPNLMQMNTSYVITDPKGELLRSCGHMLVQGGYTVKVFNLINMRNSFNYNPFAYLQDANGIYNDANVMKLINTLMKNTKAEGTTAGEQFWEDATKNLLLALSYYLVYEGREEEKNFATVMELLRTAEAREDEEGYKSPLDIIFEELEIQDPRHMAVKYYKDFKKAAGKTAKSILISCSVRLAAFNIEDVINLTYKDTINISELGERKTALFVVIPDSDDTFNFLVAMLYTQIFDVLYGMADFKYNGRLPIHVRFILDEFANIGTIPRFDKLVATMRSREISVSVILQNLTQLKTLYKESWESIIGNCDSLLFLGGKEQTSLDYISKALGKETIDTLNRNRSKGHKNNSTSLNEGLLGRELMTPDEVGVMPDSDCILLMRGIHPFYSPKYKIEEHERYALLADYNETNIYDIAHLHTEVMPKNEAYLNEYESTGLSGLKYEENETLIRSILSEGDDSMTSMVEIPYEDTNESEEVPGITLRNGVYDIDPVQKRTSSRTYSEKDIVDFTLEEGDTYSELNLEDPLVQLDDEYILPDSN